jgi:hypothetical protein
MKKTGKKMVALALVISMFTLTNAACFGKFELTRKIYTFNENVSKNPFVRTLMMWVMLIVPIYWLAGVLDLFIFNLIELFSGSNPLSMLDDHTIMVANGNSKAVISRAENSIKIDFYENNAYTGSTRVTRDGKGVVRAAGKLGSEGDFSAAYQDGTFTISDKTGKEILSRDQVQARVEASGFSVPSNM